ncbi:unnamed protein product [Linum trigynum]|uniref:Uncharacterized protein n=1 Tax=Linum trigynum TaxID=586398 RepID=A0AAV2CZI1_9ROSI
MSTARRLSLVRGEMMALEGDVQETGEIDCRLLSNERRSKGDDGAVVCLVVASCLPRRCRRGIEQRREHFSPQLRRWRWKLEGDDD